MTLLKTLLRSVQALHRVVKILEPWGILLAVFGFVFTLWAFQVDRADREEDRINRAIGQFADGIGRIDALQVLLRNDVALRSLRAKEAYLPGANLSDTILSDADLSGANLSSANLSGAILLGANLSDANLLAANLSDAELSGANLSDTILLGASLSDANLLAAELSDAELSGANLSDANLLAANLSDAELSDANLSGANLFKANFSGATLFRTNLSGANLSSANLSGAILLGASLSDANFFATYNGAPTAAYIVEMRDFEEAMFCSTTAPDGSLCNRDCDEGSTACPWLEALALEGARP